MQQDIPKSPRHMKTHTPSLEPMKNKLIFHTWKFKGVQFLATDDGRSAHVVDENGQNYGSWMQGIESFRERQTKGDALAIEPIGKASIAIKAEF